MPWPDGSRRTRRGVDALEPCRDASAPCERGFGGLRATMLYVIEQCLNGIQLGMLLFLLAAGLTLIFGIMDLVNLAHGSLYMLGAYFAATFAALTDSFLAGIGLRSEEHTSELQSLRHLVCRLLLEKKKKT